MKILSMTATFGKLQNSTLDLKPGFNLIHAPNEWGKSTWCAFLVAMLYGIDTRQRTTDSVLADKERYAPWSGQPMSGRMDILWQGRAITLERTTKGRAPLGQFRAYETETGLAVPELTAENCGKLLLGVEKEVFTRAGFIRLTDLPVTQNEALRRRLNALVTTGDESGEADRLSARLQKLKNAVRSNSKTGLLPQEQAKLQALRDDLEAQRRLKAKTCQLSERAAQLQAHLQKLYAHRRALESRAAQENRARLQEAQAREAQLKAELEKLEQKCALLPEREALRRQKTGLEEAMAARQALYMEIQMLPREAVPPEAPFCEPGEEPKAVSARVADHGKAQQRAQAVAAKGIFPLWLPGLLLAIGALWWWPLGLIGGVLTLGGALLWVRISAKKRAAKRLLEELQRQYGPQGPLGCLDALKAYEKAYETYLTAGQARSRELEQLRSRYRQQTQAVEALCGGQSPEAMLASLTDQLALWDHLADIRREHQRLCAYAGSLSALAQPAKAAPEDDMDLSQADTSALISDYESRLRVCQQELARAQGQQDALGDGGRLEAEEKALLARIAQLEHTLQALELALATLSQASAALQKRFAPQITQTARQLLCRLTGGRYDRLVLDGQLALQVGARGEDTLRDPLWRSDGTADQLYLALRLAVAQVLTPDAPLVLDDALVRFDDIRLGYALEVLQELGENSQVILFSCQDREQHMLA